MSALLACIGNWLASLVLLGLGFRKNEKLEKCSELMRPEPEDSKKIFMGFLRAFLMPTLVGKILIFYFGLKYSEYPGRGYGIGLSLSIAFTLTMLGLFIWKFRNYEDL